MEEHPSGVTQVRGISTTRSGERRRPRRLITESVDRKRCATAYLTVSERAHTPSRKARVFDALDYR